MAYPAPALAWSPSVDNPGRPPYHNAYACSSNFQSMAAKLYELGVQRNFSGMLFLIQNCEEIRRAVAAGYGGLDARHAAPVQLMINLGRFIQNEVMPYSRLIAFAHVTYSEPMSFQFTIFDNAGNSQTRNIRPEGVTGGKLFKKSKPKKTRKSKKSKKTRKSKRFL